MTGESSAVIWSDDEGGVWSINALTGRWDLTPPGNDQPVVGGPLDPFLAQGIIDHLYEKDFPEEVQ